MLFVLTSVSRLFSTTSEAPASRDQPDMQEAVKVFATCSRGLPPCTGGALFGLGSVSVALDCFSLSRSTVFTDVSLIKPGKLVQPIVQGSSLFSGVGQPGNL